MKGENDRPTKEKTKKSSSHLPKNISSFDFLQRFAFHILAGCGSSLDRKSVVVPFFYHMAY